MTAPSSRPRTPRRTRLLRLAAFTVVVSLLAAVAVVTLRPWVGRVTGINPDTGPAALVVLGLPDGFSGGPFAEGLSAPRFMAVAADGTLFVAELGADRVVALPDEDGDGRADLVVEVGAGYDRAHSLAFTAAGDLLVAGTRTVFRVRLGADLQESSREVFLDGLPAAGGHNTRTVVVRPDGWVLVSVGSSCNVCEETDPQRAAVLLVPPEGGSATVFMRGLRNAVGVAIDPATGVAWATNNGRDLLGDDLPPETLYRLVDDADAGWPRCHAGNLVDREFGARPDPSTGRTGCEGVVPADATFTAHMAPLGIAFWLDRAVIAFHGSWNRSDKAGYKVSWIPWSDGPTGPAEDLATGFLVPGESGARGRPAGVVVGADGALYVSDDKGGFIYRITRP